MTENLNDKIIIYQSEDGKTQLDVKLEGETVWLTQAQMVELFQSSKATISEHIKHIIEDDELDANSTSSEIPNSSTRRQTASFSYSRLLQS